jgi:hypothetical protein
MKCCISRDFKISSFSELPSFAIQRWSDYEGCLPDASEVVLIDFQPHLWLLVSSSISHSTRIVLQLVDIGTAVFFQLHSSEYFHIIIIIIIRSSSKSWDSAVSIATGYGLDDQGVGVRVPVGARIFTPPCRSDRLWGPRSLLSNGYRGLFPRG